MFKNPNYLWLDDYHVPSEHWLGTLYYVYIYEKLFRNGTDEDRYELEQKFDEMQSHAPFPFNLLVAIVDLEETYYKTVESFIWDRKRENWDDENERRYEVQMDEHRRKLEELEEISRKQKEESSKRIQENLAKLTSTKEKCYVNTFVHENILITKHEEIPIIIEPLKKETEIHTAIFEKYKGYYLCVFECNQTKRLEYNNSEKIGYNTVYHGWSENYEDIVAKDGTIIKGIKSIYDDFLEEFKNMVKTNNYSHQNKLIEKKELQMY